jgi:peptide/nickel transport system substrate-binding protein
MLVLLVAGAWTVLAGGPKEQPSPTPATTTQATAAATAAGLSPIELVAGRFTWPKNWLETPTAGQLGIKKFSEAPMLTEMVRAGKLPTVENRLPTDPLVIAPYEAMGKYGGTIRVAWRGPGDYGDMYRGGMFSFLFRMDPGLGKILPLIAQGYQLSSDGKQLTIFLRPGAKWSDGHAFTVEDILWVYRNMMDPNFPWDGKARWSSWIVDGKLADFAKVDDYTLRVTFPSPVTKSNQVGLLNFWRTQQGAFYMPAHHMAKYHLSSNPQAPALAKEEGFETWQAMLNAHASHEPQQPFPQPDMGSWYMESRDSTGIRNVRNPYFVAVDTAGNQLPYIDRMDVRFYSDTEVALLDMMQGKIDIGGRLLNPANFDLYKQNERIGNYRVLEWQETKTAAITYTFNLNMEDPVKGPILYDKRFRQAMSLAINRNEINQFVFKGLATPQQFTVHSGAPFYDPAWARSYAEFDPNKAKQLLDQIGMRDRDGDGFREAPGGQQFVIDMQLGSSSVTGAAAVSVSELVRDYWQAVGVKANFKALDEAFVEELRAANKLDVIIFVAEGYLHTQISPQPSFGEILGYGVNWEFWQNHERWVAGGRQGPEPPAGTQPTPEWLSYLRSWEALAGSVTDADFNKYGKEVWSKAAELLPTIGTVAYAVRPIIINNRVRNVPKTLPFAFESLLWMQPTAPQWFIQE